MSQADHIEEIAFSTGFGVDKIFPTKYNGSFSVPGSTLSPDTGNIVTQSITNLYGEDVFPIMQFSTDNATWYDAGSMKYSAGGTLDNDFSATCYTTSTNIVVVGDNFSGSAQTCYYRLLLVSEE